MDVILVPLGFLLTIAYHLWLWHKVRTQPLTTTFGRNAHGRRFWVGAMMKVSLTILLSCFYTSFQPSYHVQYVHYSLGFQWKTYSYSLLSFQTKAYLNQNKYIFFPKLSSIYFQTQYRALRSTVQLFLENPFSFFFFFFLRLESKPIFLFSLFLVLVFVVVVVCHLFCLIIKQFGISYTVLNYRSSKQKTQRPCFTSKIYQMSFASLCTKNLLGFYITVQCHFFISFYAKFHLVHVILKLNYCNAPITWSMISQK